MMVVVFFAQCGKKDDESNEEKTVPVRFEIPLEQYRSDFLNLFPNGEIKWGNKNHVEYVYLAVPRVYSYITPVFNNVQKWLGEIHVMKAECDESADKLVFHADIPRNIFWTGRTFDMYYFGNNRGNEENSNVVDIYDDYMTEYFIGKKMTFDKQTGDISELGNYHIASIPVEVKTIRDGAEIIEVQLRTKSMEFNTITSVAMLDLEGETELKGMKVKSFTLKWNGEFFEEIYEYDQENTIDVSGNAGNKSFITLLPDSEKVVLECGKGRCVFEDGIGRNQVYVGRNGNSLDEVQPLSWETP